MTSHSQLLKWISFIIFVTSHWMLFVNVNWKMKFTPTRAACHMWLNEVREGNPRIHGSISRDQLLSIQSTQIINPIRHFRSVHQMQRLVSKGASCMTNVFATLVLAHSSLLKVDKIVYWCFIVILFEFHCE